jgi:ZIP family zinc transporter
MDTPTVLAMTFVASVSGGIGGVVGCFFALNERKIALLLAFSSGVMFGVVMFNLIPEGLQSGTLLAISGFIVGIIVLFLIDIGLPHMHTTIKNRTILNTAILLTVGIAIHDIPEGLAIGIGCVKLPQIGFAIAIAIALHNIPEGLAITVMFRAAGISKKISIIIAFAASIPALLGAFIGWTVFQTLPLTFLGVGLGFAAGSMFYVCADELIPQAYKLGKGHSVTISVLGGIFIGILITLL